MVDSGDSLEIKHSKTPNNSNWSLGKWGANQSTECYTFLSTGRHGQIKKGPLSERASASKAAIGIEPMNNGFADRRLTAWLCRLAKNANGQSRN